MQQFINAALIKPDIICLQEIGTRPVKVRGYYTIFNPDYPRVATLVARDVATSTHYAQNCAMQHQIIKIHANKRGRATTIIVNIYSPPKEKGGDFENILAETISSLERKDRLVFLGDFNAPHTTWGYKRDTTKGALLLQVTERYGLQLETLPMAPTRIGNSVSRDTFPDLTFTLNSDSVIWQNLDETLGSDHYIISLSMDSAKIRRTIGKVTITDWSVYRNIPFPDNGLDNAEEWVAHIREAHARTSKQITLTTENPVIDTHLLHLWDCRRGLTRRWKRQRLNRKLRIKIAEITENANDYARKLEAENWVRFCDSMRGTLTTAKTWAILRSMLEPENTKTVTNRTLITLAEEFKGSNEALISLLREKYIGTVTMAPVIRKYNGPANGTLDAPISKAELFAAAQSARRNTAPGPDKLTYAMLRNLSDEHLEKLTDYFNRQVWDRGTLPTQWKEASIVLIPKAGKARSLYNLRPISLTSCLGKLFEKVILNRLTNHLEENDYLSDSMYGFRQHLSTQDIFLRLHDEVITNIPTGAEHVVVALDLKSAFDTIAHDLILQELSSTACGEKTYNYIRSFLTGRKATIGLGEVRSETLEMPNRGTPQGSILSPLLFNMGMNRLAKELEKIPDLKFALYADDITLWVTEGSLGHKESVLQEAIQTVHHFAVKGGMACAPEKSEFIRIHGRGYRKPQFSLRLDGEELKEAQTMRVLGLRLQSNRRADKTIRTLRTTVKQISRIIRRVTKHRSGFSEAETLRLVHAFVISRITYSLPYQELCKTDLEQTDALIRTAYKAAIGLPMSTSTAKLCALGLHNTFEELKAAVLISQRERLNLSPTGRKLLETLGYPVRPHYCEEDLVALPRAIRENLIVAPVPKNMSPFYHQGRRKARAHQLQKRFGNCSEALYTDAAPGPGGHVIVATSSMDRSKFQISATIRSKSIGTAETAAVAMAIKAKDAAGQPSVILTDSQVACRLFMQGRVPACALRILGHTLRETHSVIWCPGHVGVAGNERADALARELACRAGVQPEKPRFDHLTSPRDILEHQRLERRTYSGPHPSLSGADARDLRLIQTNTYPHLGLWHAIWPTAYPGHCPWCWGKPTLAHVTWECTSRPPKFNSPLLGSKFTNREQWETILAGADLETQRGLLDQARRAALASGVSE